METWAEFHQRMQQTTRTQPEPEHRTRKKVEEPNFAFWVVMLYAGASALIFVMSNFRP